jgi:hypothetical protein
MSNEPQYKTTFNYVLTHRVIPRIMFSDLDFFYKNIITNPENMQIFMQKATAHSAALAEGNPEIEPPYLIEKFEMNIYAKGNERSDENIIMVQLPKYEKVLDCIAVAFPTMHEKAGYYTGEVSTNPINNETICILGEWRPTEDSFKHLNYGEIAPSNYGRFIEMVIEKAYG